MSLPPLEFSHAERSHKSEPGLSKDVDTCTFGTISKGEYFKRAAAVTF